MSHGENDIAGKLYCEIHDCYFPIGEFCRLCVRELPKLRADVDELIRRVRDLEVEDF